jgi:hypothetical protein
MMHSITIFLVVTGTTFQTKPTKSFNYSLAMLCNPEFIFYYLNLVKKCKKQKLAFDCYIYKKVRMRLCPD